MHTLNKNGRRYDGIGVEKRMGTAAEKLQSHLLRRIKS